MKALSGRFGTLRFIVIAILLMLLADHFIFGGKRSYIEEAKTRPSVADAAKGPPVRVEPPDGKEFFEQVPPPEALKDLPLEEPEAKKLPDTPVPIRQEKAEEQATRKPLPPPAIHGAPKIAIIIDDLGMDVKRSRQVLDLPAPITLAFLPYGTKTREFAKIGKEKGHTLIIHTPMEAMDGKLNIGPGGLKAAMSKAEFDAAFAKMLTSFDGYVGINNHMGSRLTQDKAKMDELMGILAAKHLFFVDSKTVGSSVAAHEAAEAGVPYAERDVFLDHVESAEFTRKALAHTEALAKKRGYAIAIGHPKDFTIKGLKEWIPTLKAKGIELVSVQDLLVTPKTPVVPKLEEPGPSAPVEAIAPQETNEVIPALDMFPEHEENWQGLY
ncbi:MAG: hypothetical protein DI551_08575 [Micavibrio aeruginosavorus]|uniref:Divergent polysaccharide deacetylase family protein n=1 Tax=Micavibrio aeruginosavorus TaxID=349221 RepID=A0A2W5MUV0_9BACT|nr:MAG: hypothetical protein DI551_08575 [Micavibrio aeruginosavorus]